MARTKYERLADGDIIFYPAKYESYQTFKTQYLETTYTTKLLIVRLKLLLKYRKISDSNLEIELDCSEIKLRCNATTATIESIVFNDTYEIEEINKSIQNIVEVLKSRLSNGMYETSHPDKITKLLEKLEKVK